MMTIPLKSRFIQLSEEEFFIFCHEMRDFRIERERDGTILIKQPKFTIEGVFSATILAELTLWNRRLKNGKTFDSSTGFTLPNEAVRSPRCFLGSFGKMEESL